MQQLFCFFCSTYFQSDQLNNTCFYMIFTMRIQCSVHTHAQIVNDSQLCYNVNRKKQQILLLLSVSFQLLSLFFYQMQSDILYDRVLHATCRGRALNRVHRFTNYALVYSLEADLFEYRSYIQCLVYHKQSNSIALNTARINFRLIVTIKISQSVFYTVILLLCCVTGGCFVFRHRIHRFLVVHFT